jgi:hypothetical protein
MELNPNFSYRFQSFLSTLEYRILDTKIKCSGVVVLNFFTTKKIFSYFSPYRSLAFFKIPSPIKLFLLTDNYVVSLDWTRSMEGVAQLDKCTPLTLISCSRSSQKIRESPSLHYDPSLFGFVTCIELLLQAKGKTALVSFCTWKQRQACMSGEPDEKQSVPWITSHCNAKRRKRTSAAVYGEIAVDKDKPTSTS